jgi:hypothetical protein
MSPTLDPEGFAPTKGNTVDNQQPSQTQRSQTPPTATRPSIVVNECSHSELLAEVARVLVADTTSRMEEPDGPGQVPLLFLRAGSLVGLRKEQGEPRLSSLGDAVMFGLLARAADWHSRRRKGKEPLVAARPPMDVAKHLLAFPPADLPAIEAIAVTPVFGRDGALLTKPGYHPADRLWLHSEPLLGAIDVPEAPSSQDVADARALLESELLGDFPFSRKSDKAHALAALLLPFTRRLFDGGTPLHLIEAPMTGSGTGLLANLISVIATGKPCEVRVLSGLEDERRKMLAATLATGGSIILLDHLVRRTLDSQALASILTSNPVRVHSTRETGMVALPNTATWLATGDTTLRLSPVMARRCVHIRIDCKHETPWLRSGFRHDPLLEWVRHQRPALVRAALTLVQAWVQAGRPPGKVRLGSFEGWSTVTGGILEVAGVEGFLGNLDAFYDTDDDEAESWRAFTQAWWQRHGQKPIRVGELNHLCEELGLLRRLRGEGTTKSQQTQLGLALLASKDRVFGGLRLSLAYDGGDKGKLYTLSPTVKLADPPALPESDDAVAS